MKSTKQQEHKKSKATSSLFLNDIIAKLKNKHILFTVRHWKEILPSQKYAFLEGKVFQLNNFTMDGFSFQLVFSLKIGRFYHPS